MKEHFKRIGTIMNYHVDGLAFEVKILDVKTAYGRIDYLITPVAGSGEKRVSSTSVTQKEE